MTAPSAYLVPDVTFETPHSTRRPRAAEAGDVVEAPPRPGVVERMTQILDVFLTHEGAQRLEDVTACTGLPRSTTFRLLSQLVSLQWLEHTSHGYRLGGRILGIPSHVVDHGELRSAAADVLNELHLRTGAVAHLGVLDGATVTYLDKIGGRASTTMPSRVGGRLPAYGTVLGRTLLACLPAEDVEVLLSTDAAQRQRPLDLALLHQQLQRIRQQNGVAKHEVTRHSGSITAVAAPVMGPDGAVGAIALAGRGPLRLDPIAPLVVAAARRTSQLMFPRWHAQATPSPRRRTARG